MPEAFGPQQVSQASTYNSVLQLLSQLDDSTSLSTRHAELHACLIASVPRCHTGSRADRVRLRCSGSLAQKKREAFQNCYKFLGSWIGKHPALA